jgi:hypothetical protein
MIRRGAAKRAWVQKQRDEREQNKQLKTAGNVERSKGSGSSSRRKLHRSDAAAGRRRISEY